MNSAPNGFLVKLAVEYIIACMFLDNNLQGSSHRPRAVGFCLRNRKDYIYEVSNFGNVRSLDRVISSKHNGTTLRKGRILTPFYEEKKGYYQVALSKDGKQKKQRIHRLVAVAFLENPLNYTDVNHKDEDKTNNNVDNLEWCTRKYNNNYGTKPERTRKAMMGNTNGRKAWFIKRNEVDNGNDD